MLKYLIAATLLLLGGRVSAGRPSGTKVDSLIEQASSASRREDFARVGEAAEKLLEIGRKDENRIAALYGSIYRGHSLTRENDDSVRYYYNRALELGAEMEDYPAMAKVYNALGLYTLETEMNYLKGHSYFMEALKYAAMSPDRQGYSIILINLGTAHYLRGDTNGLKYSLEAVEIGKETNDPQLLYSGSFVTAYMYYLMEDYAAALRSIETALESGGPYVEFVESYSLYANILVRLGREQEAVHYYRRSLELAETEKGSALVFTHYGDYLIEKGRPGDAIAVLEKGLDYAERRNNAFYRYLIYEKLSKAYELDGQPRRALEYYKIYRNETDSVFHIGRERAINELRVQYESEKQENELREKELVLLRQEQKLDVAVLVAIVLVGVVIGLWTDNRRKNRRYRQIAIQQHDLMHKERVIEELQERGGKYTVSSLSDEKGQALFAEFERLMKEKNYRERNITIEKVAQTLSTNRSYLSRAINENSGMSFSQYIDSQRIDEARRVLSDANNDIQIKELAYHLGFSTPETFSASFRKSIGMLPSKFREQMRKLYDERRGRD